ncbi:TPA: plasmid replication initiator TrfA [Pseudomonas aeruginosa]|uniref:plasmid replication initiator TrfA n=1 Tax=Pseudomonas aeruginosa TaxID=287 RepID=UPI00069416D8|nr:plasmid replication initiator TrfA [Pseudomonas aeruginosa]MDK8403929.1 plasmid replication initiator TrfA [Pseudomonas aeruginosa]MDK8443399.1 plasmid replication initiator TrfA [Pseudomonas aeruginosa]MDK8561951.1 plasmid replication initiator TrfA [Pseudomonas aeruginosa]WCI73221.1 plasmid replication initiator TrfA [Pseudomonas aeruginosa]HBN8047068.1 hypothetical protein [Pseudomonas aeruginosa]
MSDKPSTSRLAERIRQVQEKNTRKGKSKPSTDVASSDTQSGTPLQLPFWPEATRGVPSGFLRSALFAGIQSKDRRFLKDEVIEAVGGVEIRFRGEQLDQTDLDVWEAVLHLARINQLSTKDRLRFNAHGMLKMLDRSTGGDQHDWLKTTLLRLTGAILDIKVGTQAYFGPMLEGGTRDEATDEYEIWVNPKIRALYEAGWTQINNDQRNALRRKPLAQWLHGWYSSHAAPYPISVETFYKLSGSTNKQMAGYKRLLMQAHDDLVAIGVLTSWEIKNRLVAVSKPQTPSQKRFLERKSQRADDGPEGGRQAEFIIEHQPE